MTQPHHEDRTILAATLEEPHRPGRNLIWCSSFQLVYNELRSAEGEPVELSPMPEVAAALGRSRASSADIDGASFLTAVIDPGLPAEQLEELRASEAIRALVARALASGGLVIFARIQKCFVFPWPFREESTGSKLAFQGTPVECFGAWQQPFGMDLDIDPAVIQEALHDSKMSRKNISVHRYAGRDDFVVELRARDRDDRMLIARRAPGPTFEATVDAVLATASGIAEGTEPSVPLGGPGTFESRDELIVPKMTVSRERTFDELRGCAVQSGPRRGMVVEEAVQNITFSLDERGAELLSEAAMALGYGAPPPRQFICDGSFLVLLWRRNAERPYLALWVENTALLRPTG